MRARQRNYFEDINITNGKLTPKESSGTDTTYLYTPTGSSKPTHEVKATSHHSAEQELLREGVFSWEDYWNKDRQSRVTKL